MHKIAASKNLEFFFSSDCDLLRVSELYTKSCARSRILNYDKKVKINIHEFFYLNYGNWKTLLVSIESLMMVIASRVQIHWIKIIDCKSKAVAH